MAPGTRRGGKFHNVRPHAQKQRKLFAVGVKFSAFVGFAGAGITKVVDYATSVVSWVGPWLTQVTGGHLPSFVSQHAGPTVLTTTGILATAVVGTAISKRQQARERAIQSEEDNPVRATGKIVGDGSDGSSPTTESSVQDEESAPATAAVPRARNSSASRNRGGNVIDTDDVINSYQQVANLMDDPNARQAEAQGTLDELGKQFAAMSLLNQAQMVQGVHDSVGEKFAQAVSLWEDACKEVIGVLEQVKSGG